MDWLSEIIEYKRKEVEKRKRKTPLAELEKLVEKTLAKNPNERGESKSFFEKRSLVDSLAGARTLRGAIVGEMKRCSPSTGEMNTALDPEKLAAAYENAGLGGISVLTDEKYFGGGLADLTRARKNTVLPILLKDFVLDPYQLWEARIAGADAFLLIAEALSPVQARNLLDVGKELSMEPLFEIHSSTNLHMALELDPPIVGINNRNLRTLQVNLMTTATLLDQMDAGWKEERLIMAMSGIKTRNDIVRLKEAGADAFLIGTSFMHADMNALTKASSIEAAVFELTGEGPITARPLARDGSPMADGRGNRK
jgi:indole-3-glycerol phosphate synthase